MKAVIPKVEQGLEALKAYLVHLKLLSRRGPNTLTTTDEMATSDGVLAVLQLADTGCIAVRNSRSRSFAG